MTATHIIGNFRSDNYSLDILLNTLEQLGIQTDHTPGYESFNLVSAHPAWHHYDTQLALYESIAEAPFYIILNDGEITEDIARQIMYAMTKNRPILMTGAPKLSHKLTAFSRDLILSHLHKFHAINLTDLDIDEMKMLIEQLQPVDYKLSGNDATLIHSRVKAHFRRLLDEARDIYVEAN